jgi:hypothetical protein
MSTLVPILNSDAVDGWDVYNGWRMQRNAKKIYQANLHQKRLKWRPKARRKDDVEKGIRKMGIVNWRQVV